MTAIAIFKTLPPSATKERDASRWLAHADDVSMWSATSIERSRTQKIVAMKVPLSTRRAVVLGRRRHLGQRQRDVADGQRPPDRQRPAEARDDRVVPAMGRARRQPPEQEAREPAEHGAGEQRAGDPDQNGERAPAEQSLHASQEIGMGGGMHARTLSDRDRAHRSRRPTGRLLHMSELVGIDHRTHGGDCAVDDVQRHDPDGAPVAIWKTAPG